MDGSSSGPIWNIYYHLYIDEPTIQKLEDQSRKLYNLSESIESWHQSKYGAFLRICDVGSLARFRKMWKLFHETRLSNDNSTKNKARLQSAIQRAKNMQKNRVGKDPVLTGLRASAPLSLQAITDLPRLYSEFWDTGVTDKVKDVRRSVMHPNPMFAASTIDTTTLHYGTDPIFGFHLATGYAQLLEGSPLQVQSNGSGLPKAVKAARSQFQAWSEAFRSHLSKGIKIRFFAGDALAFCFALQTRGQARNSCKCHLYRDPFHFEKLTLNDNEYGEEGDAPTMFTVIDTSNLIDHLGGLNILVASSPLLMKTASARLYTEVLVKRASNVRASIGDLFCGDLATVALLLGLFPVEYWTNASAASTVDETMLDAVARTMFVSERSSGQMYCRLTWKSALMGNTVSKEQKNTRLGFDAVDLAHILFGVYQKMFQHENMKLKFADNSLHRIQNDSCPNNHRGSLAAFIALVKEYVSTDWTLAMENFRSLVECDSSILMGWNYMQELYLYLHTLDVYSVRALQSDQQEALVNFGAAQNAEGCPPVLCVTLKVPRAALKKITSVPHSKLGTPLLHCSIQSSNKYGERNWHNIFSAVQLAFGEPTTTGSQHNGDLHLSLKSDENDGWTGSAPLLVSFYVPSCTLGIEPLTAIVAFGILSTPLSVFTFLKILGPEMNIYETNLGNNSNVYITKYAPNQSGYPWHRASSQLKANCAQASDHFFGATISPVVNRETRRMEAFTCRVNLNSDKVKKVFQEGAPAKTDQTSACVITVTIGTDFEHKISFPAPVLQPRCKLRLARKSSWIEVVVPIARPEAQDRLPHFMHPMSLDMEHPVNWNLPYLDLDRLPMLDANKTGPLQWLITHTSLMFSTRERTLRETSVHQDNGIHSDVRLNFKESLFTIFMRFSGLQGGRCGTFMLQDPTRGRPSVMIIGFRLRLDLANRTVALDAAVVPLAQIPVARVRAFLEVFPANSSTISVDEDEMKLWALNIPAYAERCRKWSHSPSCEYRSGSSIPISVDCNGSLLCSCGKGRFPSDFLSKTPGWGIISKHATRIAITPSFSVPYVEGICGLNLDDSAISDVNACENCGKKKRADGKALFRCGKCRKAMYCSAECQRAKWTAHKPACVPVAQQA